MTASPAIVASKEHPLIFTGESVRAILDGRKTQSRRVIPRPSFKKNGKRIVPGCDACWAASVPHNGEEAAFGGPCYLRVPGCDHVGHDGYPGGGRIWPKWRVGDQLWVKEACRPGYFEGLPFDDVSKCAYRADWSTRAADVAKEPKWTSPLYMPRSCSRITLDVTAVRVQRLQEITDEDALAEGATFEVGGMVAYPRLHFLDRWNTINGKRAPWESNPFVHVISFRRLKP